MFGAIAAADSVSSHVPILHIERGSPVRVLALSVMEGVYVHFEGRSLVCPGDSDCRLCGVGRSKRFVGFFAVLSRDQRFLVRLTAQAAMRMLNHPPKPGKIYQIESRGQKKPLDVAATGFAEIPSGQQMERTELLRLLMSIHGLGLPNGGESEEELLQLAQERAKKVIDRSCCL